MAQSQARRRPAPSMGIDQWTGRWRDFELRQARALEEFRAAKRHAEKAINHLKERLEVETRPAVEVAGQALGQFASTLPPPVREFAETTVKNHVAAGRGMVALAKDPTSREAQAFVKEAGANLAAAAHGAGDAFTLGAADHASAGVRALYESGFEAEALRQNYLRNIAAERAQDAYEAEHYGGARLGGQVAGTLAQFAVGAPVAGALKVGSAAKAAPAIRYVRTASGGKVAATPMNAREKISLAAAGAASGLGSELAGDLTGKESTLQDYLVAGGVGALLPGMGVRRSAVQLGAVGGAATSVGQDVANGREVSLSDAAIGAGAGSLGGLLAGRSGRDWSSGLPERGKREVLTKGRLGEELMRGRSVLRGDRIVEGDHRFYLPSGRYSVPDGYTDKGLTEAKFGAGTLSRRQGEARQVMLNSGREYRIDNFQPRDLEVIFGLPAGQLTSQIGQGLWDRLTVEHQPEPSLQSSRFREPR